MKLLSYSSASARVGHKYPDVSDATAALVDRLDDDPPDADAEFEPEATVHALEKAVDALGFKPVRVGTAEQLWARGADLALDAAINIAEGIRGRNREGYAPMLLEMAGVPYVGSDALTLSLSLDKAWTKDLAAAAAASAVGVDRRSRAAAVVPGPGRAACSA